MDTTPSREQVKLFEPRAGVPVADQPVLLELFSMPRKQLVKPWRWLFTLVGVAGVFLPAHPLGIAPPALVALAGLTGLVVTARATRFVPRGEFAALTSSPAREVRGTELRMSGRTVAFRLADDAQWAVARLWEGDALMLARLRRVWVFGPSPSGWVGLMVPGGSPVMGRLADAPPSGADLVPVPTPPAEWPPVPQDDPAVRLALATRLRASVYSLVLVVAAIALVTVDALVWTAENAATPVVTLSVMAIVLVLLIVGTAPELGRVRRASRSGRWAWTKVVVEEPTFLGTSRMKLRTRVDVPGEEVHLEVTGPPALVLAVHESNQVWLIGDLHSTRPMIAGIPETPLVGRVRRSFTPTR